jgi:hypothetical protein
MSNPRTFLGAGYVMEMALETPRVPIGSGWATADRGPPDAWGHGGSADPAGGLGPAPALGAIPAALAKSRGALVGSVR